MSVSRQLEKDARWPCAGACRATSWRWLPGSGRRPTPKQFDGHDVSLRFSITHGSAHPVAAVAAVVATIVMGQGWTGEKFSWGARVHEPEVGCWALCWNLPPRQLVSSPAPFPLPFCCLWPDVPSWAKETWRGRGVGMAGPSRPSALLSFLPPVSSSWMTRTC